jgi:hypothetical protein
MPTRRGAQRVVRRRPTRRGAHAARPLSLGVDGRVVALALVPTVFLPQPFFPWRFSRT